MLNIEYVYWWEITLYRFFIIFWICKDDNMYLIYVLSCGSLDVVFEFCMLKNKRQRLIDFEQRERGEFGLL